MKYRPVLMPDGLYAWEVDTSALATPGHSIQKGDLIHVEHEARGRDTTVLHSADWPSERKARFRLWHNGEAVDPQVVRHASYDGEGKLRLHTVGQTVTVKPDAREGSPTQTQGVVEDARVLGT